jgi:2-oxoglutarate ferredoxin oxidoreductase subunit alpha
MVPYSLPIGDKNLVRHCSSTHGPEGQITTDVEEIGRTMNRLREKLNAAVDRFSFYELLTHADARTLVITYGVTARAAKDLFLERQKGGDPFSLLVLKTLWPVPENLVRRTAGNHDRVIVLEMNMGQYVREIERILPGMRVDGFGQMDGRLITPWQIGEVLDHA